LYDIILDSCELDKIRAFETPIVLGLGGLNRLVVSSTDVLHSLGVPNLGIKLDSSPGRLNSTTVEVEFQGYFLGSCFELCGIGHRMMPIHFLVI
jgi:heme/copper-type cytochrome/quinol oxidase subunit 2